MHNPSDNYTIFFYSKNALMIFIFLFRLISYFPIFLIGIISIFIFLFIALQIWIQSHVKFMESTTIKQNNHLSALIFFSKKKIFRLQYNSRNYLKFFWKKDPGCGTKNFTVYQINVNGVVEKKSPPKIQYQ